MFLSIIFSILENFWGLFQITLFFGYFRYFICIFPSTDLTGYFPSAFSFYFFFHCSFPLFFFASLFLCFFFPFSYFLLHATSPKYLPPTNSLSFFSLSWPEARLARCKAQPLAERGTYSPLNLSFSFSNLFISLISLAFSIFFFSLHNLYPSLFSSIGRPPPTRASASLTGDLSVYPR